MSPFVSAQLRIRTALHVRSESQRCAEAANRSRRRPQGQPRPDGELLQSQTPSESDLLQHSISGINVRGASHVFVLQLLKGGIESQQMSRLWFWHRIVDHMVKCTHHHHRRNSECFECLRMLSSIGNWPHTIVWPNPRSPNKYYSVDVTFNINIYTSYYIYEYKCVANYINIQIKYGKWRKTGNITNKSQNTRATCAVLSLCRCLYISGRQARMSKKNYRTGNYIDLLPVRQYTIEHTKKQNLDVYPTILTSPM